MNIVNKTIKTSLLCFLLISFSPSFAESTPVSTESENVALVKDLFKNVIGNLDSKKMPDYFAQDAVQYVNNQAISLTQDMKIHGNVYQKTKRIEYHFDDIFGCGDKVVARLRFNHVDDKGQDHWFREIFIVEIKNHKIKTMWDLFLPLEPYKTDNTKMVVPK